MRSRLTKKRMLSLASVLVIALAGIAYAFYSSTGAGSGSGSAAGDDGSAINVVGTVTDPLVPGGSSAVTFTAANSGTAAGTLRSIHLSSVTVDTPHATAGCLSTWFTMPNVSGLSVSVPNDSPTTHAVGTDGTLSMSNESTSQDACKGASLTLGFTTG
jgi:hypothetical protein